MKRKQLIRGLPPPNPDEEVEEVKDITVSILDGTVIVQMLKPMQSKNFKEYAENIFTNYEKMLARKRSLHLVFDVYQTNSLKTSTRQARGSGIRLRLQDDAPMPRKWSMLLRCDTNKRELFGYLAEFTIKKFRNAREVFVTIGNTVKCSMDGYDLSELSPCTHEEADTRMILHSLHEA